MILETERLVLRYLRETDISILREIIFSDAEVMAYLPYGRVLNQQEAEEFIRQYFPVKDDQIGLFVIEEKESNQVVGFTGSVPFSGLDEEDVEFGFGFGKSYWNLGFGREIGAAFIQFILDVVKYPRLMALVAPPNKPSIHVLEKLGYQFISTTELPNRGERCIYYIDKQVLNNKSE